MAGWYAPDTSMAPVPIYNRRVAMYQFVGELVAALTGNIPS
jgi:hypothetical protein